MARKRSGKTTPHPEWITKSPNGIETGYQKITRSLQYSDAVKGLSNLAYRVYIDMLVSSKGLQEVEYPQSVAMSHMKISKGGYTDATNQIVAAGLAKKKPRGCYAKSVYCFTEEWKNYELPRDIMTNQIIWPTNK